MEMDHYERKIKKVGQNVQNGRPQNLKIDAFKHKPLTIEMEGSKSDLAKSVKLLGLHFFCKNKLNKNNEAEIDQKIKAN